jgi:DNA-binding PadR family transcriptional regulator
MSQDLPTTSYALLGLLTFGDELTGYELKQRADNTLRFYWVAPAMSQVYTEVSRLAELGLVDVRDDRAGWRTTRRYRINDTGLAELRQWLETSEPEFPVLKHSIALRLLLGHLVDPSQVRAMLLAYVDSLDRQRADLQQVLTSIEERSGFEFPAMVARWGLAYYDGEATVVADIAEHLPDTTSRQAGRPPKDPTASGS